MAGGGTTVERLRQYLREVAPSARSMLIAELERNLLRGDESAGAHFMLQELRAIVREQHETAPRIGNSARLFFQSLEPFLVDDAADHRHPGRIARAALESLWTWIRRDLLPEEAKVLTEAVSEALLANDNARAAQLMRAFQDRVGGAIEAGFCADAADDGSGRRLLAQIGTPRAAEDATVLLRALKYRDAIAAFASRIPLQILNLADNQLADTKALIDAAAANENDILLPALLTVMSRLSATWQLIRLAVCAADSNIAARVAETPYAVTVEIALAEVDRLVGELGNGLHSGQGVAIGMQLKTIHDAMLGLRKELALPVDSGWGRRLAAQRVQLSDLIRTQVEVMPDRVQHLLRPRPSTEIRPDSELDVDDVAATATLIEFVGNCRQFAGEPVTGELAQRAFVELRQYLDGATGALLDGFRHAGTADRRFRQSQVNAAARFCAVVFGKAYAAPLFKATEAQAPEAKLAQA
jgi:hypothetical protein